jgi:hypothetical protein
MPAVLHRKVIPSADLCDLVDGADIGMVQRGGCSRFTAKPLCCLRVVDELIGKEFEGNEATELEILSFVDLAHTSTAHLFQDSIVRDGLAYQKQTAPPWRKILGVMVADVNGRVSGSRQTGHFDSSHRAIAPGWQTFPYRITEGLPVIRQEFSKRSRYTSPYRPSGPDSTFRKVAKSGSTGFGVAKFAFVEFPFALQSSKEAQKFWMVAQTCEVRIVAEQGVIRQPRPCGLLQD